MSTLGKQLKERVAINDLAKQISQSSGNISQLRAKLDLASEGDLQRRETELQSREKALEALRVEVSERRATITARKRKLVQESEEIRSREVETRMDYQREKQEISADLDKIELGHMSDLRGLRDKAVETEVEVRQMQSEVEKLKAAISKEASGHQAKMDEFAI